MPVRLPTDTSDDFRTPEAAWDIFQKYVKIPVENTVWCPFYMKGDLTAQAGLKHAKIVHEDKDFFEPTTEPEAWDCIVDNPPYGGGKARGVKELILKRMHDLGKPYALLLPLDTMERKYFREHIENEPDYTIIIPRERYNFQGKDGKTQKHNTQKTCWFCFRWGLGKQMIID